MENRHQIAVIGHLSNAPRLPEGFEYITRKSDFALYPDIAGEYKFHAASYVWSEYAAWFENSRLIKGDGVRGLYHYRCALNFHFGSVGVLPNFLRYKFLTLQSRHLINLENFLIVGHANYVCESVWRQFLEAHPESIAFLEAAANEYDAIVGNRIGHSLGRLKTINYYYPRNIFLTDTKFGENWLEISFSLAKYLDQTCANTPENRWGGFVLERIFSLYLEDFVSSNDVLFSSCTQIYFATTINIIKGKLLKYKSIQRIKVYLGADSPD